MEEFENDIHRLIDAGKHLFEQGWSPATSSNYSLRLNDREILITASGKHKGQLTRDDFIVVNLNGEISSTYQTNNNPSAETLLHCQLYQRNSHTRSVLHTHSVDATVLSRYLARQDRLELNGYELQKAFEGVSTHETSTVIPIVENHQDMKTLTNSVENALNQAPHCPAYLIRGHGLYSWGGTLENTLRHIEALEFLFQCEIKTTLLKQN